jgi:hypothetical protein
MTFATATLNHFDSQISNIQDQIAALQLTLSEIQSRRQSAQAIEQMGQSAIDQVLAMLGSCDVAGFPELKDVFISAVRDVLDSKIAAQLPSNTWDTDTFESEPVPPAAPPEPTPEAPTHSPHITPLEETPEAIEVEVSPLESTASTALAVADKEPTILEVKQRFIRQFNLSSSMSENRVTIKTMRDFLHDKSWVCDAKTQKIFLEGTNKEFWMAAYRLMDKLQKAK